MRTAPFMCLARFSSPLPIMRLASLWYGSHPLSLFLAPLGWIFAAVVAMRRYAYGAGLLRRERLPVPVIVVGNITVGGTGKTPLIIWLVEALRRAGHRPGVVSRGYGGATSSQPRTVDGDSDPRAVGDEPVLIARRCGCPVVVGARRTAAARYLLAQHECDVILCDDGLQHYALARDLEIALVDGVRRLGNGRCLPAGPLRERPSRLQSVDMVIVNGAARAGEFSMQLTGGKARSLLDPDSVQALERWRGESVHGVAGIGNPGRFFAHLRDHGLKVAEHPFPDHHYFRPEELQFGDEQPVFMTEKDAVKCRDFALAGQWYVPVRAQLDEACRQRLQVLLKAVLPGAGEGASALQ